jgi:hypothetical protein
MNRSIKGLLLGLAICLLGAVPASASAGVLYSGASEVPVGTHVTGKALETIKFYSGPEVFFECTGAQLAGTVSQNGTEMVSTTVESLVFTGTWAEGKCATSFGGAKVSLNLPAGLRYTKTLEPGEEWFIYGASSPNSLIPGLTIAYPTFTCKYRGANTAALSFGSNIGTEPLVLKERTAGGEFLAEAGSPPGCPSLTVKNLRMELKTAAGGGLKVTK